MRKDKGQATKLRKLGKSYSEINRILGVPKGTLSDWFTGMPLSDKARSRINNKVYAGSLRGIIKSAKLHTHLAQKKAREVRKMAKESIGRLTKSELFFVGVSLYWGEGYKRPIIRNGKVRTYHSIVLSNSDPILIQIFLRFLREICGIKNDMIRVNIHAYEHQNIDLIRNYWSKITGVAEDKFKKSYFGISKASKGKRSRNTLPYGTLQIRVNSTILYHTIMGWIDGIGK